MKETKNELNNHKTNLKKEKSETQIAEQEVAIILHKQDIGKEIRKKVISEQEYFTNLVIENKTKLNKMLSYDGIINSFLRLVNYLNKFSQKESNEKEEIESTRKSFIDNQDNLEKIKKLILTKYKKMHLKISNLSDLFKENQVFIKQKKQQFEIISESLLKKEELLEKVVQPNNDFGSIMRSFIQENQENDEKKSEQIFKASQNISLTGHKINKSKFNFNSDESQDEEDKILREIKIQNKRLLRQVDYLKMLI